MLPSVCNTSSCIFKTYYYYFAGSSIATRYVRSLAKRKMRSDPIRTLEGKVRTERPVYNSVELDFQNVKRVSDLKKVYPKIFVNSNEHEIEMELERYREHESNFEHADKYYVVNEWEKQQRSNMIQKKMIEKKYFSCPETNLLTYTAKWQIHYLHKQDKTEWTPERLAECFPAATVHGIKRILKNSLIWTKEAIKGHDAEVERKWKLLESGEDKEISPVTWKLYGEGKITRENYNGNPSFPVPSPLLENTRGPKKLGEFMSIIKPYLECKKNNKEKSVAVHSISENDTLARSPSNMNLTAYEYLNNDVTKAVLPELKYRYPTRREMEDPECASFLATENYDENETDLPCSQFEENLEQEFSEKKKKTTVDIAYEEWLENQAVGKLASEENSPPIDPKDLKEIMDNEFELIRKYNTGYMNNEDSDSPLNNNVNPQYIPAKEPIKKRIKIPKHLKKEGALYRVGNCYYSENGIFLYKVCV